MLEAPPRQQLLGHELSIPYLLDTLGSSTRWSYGLANGQSELFLLMNLARDEASLSTEAKVLKFVGILVEKTYTAAEQDRLVVMLQANGVCSMGRCLLLAFFTLMRARGRGENARFRYTKPIDEFAPPKMGSLRPSAVTDYLIGEPSWTSIE